MRTEETIREELKEMEEYIDSLKGMELTKKSAKKLRKEYIKEEEIRIHSLKWVLEEIDDN